ncbi:hypothetical protein B0H19DRAFT_1096844 [Mycena capillaripes]|nr:hypothetical protein B0H19DRAFT_1096844 [Mycena capillaripes]
MSLPERPASPISSKPSKSQPPFDAVKADVILRTSDDVDFRVFKLILSLASPFFGDMFGLPQDPSADDVQVVTVQEDSSVMDKLLRFCYPCPAPVIDTLDELHIIIEAMMKYQMFEIAKETEGILLSFARANPVAVFAISCRFGWEGAAKAAARESLALPLRNFDKHVATKELKYLTGDQYQALLQYHGECSAAAAAIVADFRWLNNDGGWVWFTCQACLPHPSPQVFTSRLGYGNDTRHVRRWFMDFIESSRALVADSPKAIIGTVALLTPVLKQTHACKNCCDLSFEQLLKFLNEFLGPKIEEEIRKVSFELTL